MYTILYRNLNRIFLLFQVTDLHCVQLRTQTLFVLRAQADTTTMILYRHCISMSTASAKSISYVLRVSNLAIIKIISVFIILYKL